MRNKEGRIKAVLKTSCKPGTWVWVKKVKSTISHEEYWWDAHLYYLGLEPVGGYTAQVCDAWPVRRQTYGYLPSRRTLLPRDWYQIILHGDRGTCVNNLLFSDSGTAGS